MKRIFTTDNVVKLAVIALIAGVLYTAYLYFVAGQFGV
jgi:hypothetical protein